MTAGAPFIIGVQLDLHGVDVGLPAGTGYAVEAYARRGDRPARMIATASGRSPADAAGHSAQ